MIKMIKLINYWGWLFSYAYKYDDIRNDAIELNAGPTDNCIIDIVNADESTVKISKASHECFELEITFDNTLPGFIKSLAAATSSFDFDNYAIEQYQAATSAEDYDPYGYDFVELQDFVDDSQSCLCMMHGLHYSLEEMFIRGEL